MEKEEITVRLAKPPKKGLLRLVFSRFFLILLLFTRYVSLGSVVGAALCPVYLWIFGHERLSIILGALCALLIVIKHAENIVRLISGTERRIDFGASRKKREEDDFANP